MKKRCRRIKLPKKIPNINLTVDGGKTTYKGSVSKRGNNYNVKFKRKKKSFLDDLF